MHERVRFVDQQFRRVTDDASGREGSCEGVEEPRVQRVPYSRTSRWTRACLCGSVTAARPECDGSDRSDGHGTHARPPLCLCLDPLLCNRNLPVEQVEVAVQTFARALYLVFD